MLQLPKRLLSIDVLRAITMMFMIFVNDADGTSNIPHWIGHAEAKADALGFADTIFPAFLFIVGLSLPFAIKSRLKNGKSVFNVAVYILTRSVALLIMGFFHVNLDEYNGHFALLSKPVWAILATTAFFMIWLDYPETLAKVKRYGLMAGGFMLLIFLAIVYKGGDAADLHGMAPEWWGILGIIGWAYLVCALIYLLARGKLAILIPVWIVFLITNICFHTHVLEDWFWIIGDASSVTLVIGGVIITEVYANLVTKQKTQLLWPVLSVAGVLAIGSGLLIRAYSGGISKIHSTPAWVLICSGITILVFEALVYLVDVKGKQKYFHFIKPAGTSTLTCYLIPYYQYFIFKLLHINYPDVITEGIVGLLRSMATALIIIWLVGLLENKHLRLKI